MGGHGESSDPTVGDAAAASERFLEWFLLFGSRLAVAALLVGTLLLALFVLEFAGLLGVDDKNPLLLLYSAFIGGNLTLITVVLSINQLVLSRQLESPGQLREEIDSVAEFRENVREIADLASTPVQFPAFLQVLLDATRQQAQSFGGLTVGSTDPEFREHADGLVSTVTENVDRVDGLLDESDIAIFDVLSVTLQLNFSEQIRAARELRMGYADRLSEDEDEALEALVHDMEQVDVARQYFKAIYMQDELSRLSRTLLYVGTPAVAVPVTMLLVFAVPFQATVSTAVLTVLVPVASAVALVPLAVLFAYVSRLTVVAQRTAAVTPFTISRRNR